MPSVIERITKNAGGRKLVLYIGGANGALYTRYRGDGWHVVRASFDAALKPDIDLNKVSLGSLPRGSMDAVWCADTLEYMPREKAIVLIKTSHALVKTGGEWGCCMPDMESLSAYIAAKRGVEPLITMPDGRNKSAIELAFGYPQAPHLQGFTPDSVAQLLTECGIQSASVTSRALYLWVGGVVGDTSAEGKRIRIRRSAQSVAPPAPPPLAKQMHPGQFFANRLPDELDLPPKRYDGIAD